MTCTNLLVGINLLRVTPPRAFHRYDIGGGGTFLVCPCTPCAPPLPDLKDVRTHLPRGLNFFLFFRVFSQVLLLVNALQLFFDAVIRKLYLICLFTKSVFLISTRFLSAGAVASITCIYLFSYFYKCYYYFYYFKRCKWE